MSLNYDFPCPVCPNAGMNALPRSFLVTGDLLFYCPKCASYFQQIKRKNLEKLIKQAVPLAEWEDG